MEDKSSAQVTGKVYRTRIKHLSTHSPLPADTHISFLLISDGFSCLVLVVGTMASDDSSDTLEFTPTWVVAVVCSIIIVISLCAERLLHYIGKFLKHKRQDALFQALQKLKEELMLLGFISLLLTVFQSLISEICITKKLTSHMLPCKKESSHTVKVMHYKRFFMGHTWKTWRLLSEVDGSNTCASQGKVPLLSREALHHLHIFIFVLALVHVVFCAITVVLGGAKIRRCRHWEEAIQKENMNLSSNEHLHHHKQHHDFVSQHAMGYWRKSVVVNWMMSFFKQFYASVTKSDYRALRSGFIMMHCKTNPHFNFHKYMMRALEDDFKKIVGISWYLWLFVIIFLLLDVHGWHIYFWLAFLPLILLLAVGAKLEHIITRLAQEIAENPTDDQAARLKPSDHRFWFHKPGIVLYVIHFILFQNAFEIAFFFWIWSTYGFHSCIMESVGYLIPRLVIGVIIQVLCSYSTLPLYAIVTQMGGSYKQAIFAQHRQAALHSWAASARKKRSGISGISSFFGMFGHRKKESTSGAQLQMQGMSIESSNGDQQLDALEGIVVSAIEGPQTHGIQEGDGRLSLVLEGGVRDHQPAHQ